MEVTPIGLILLIAGPLLMVFRPNWLYLLTIFFLPFTATDLINVGSGDNVSGLQASMYLGSLAILRYFTGLLWKGRIPLPRSGRASLIWLGLFIAATALSLVMPLWIDGRVQIPSPWLRDIGLSDPLYLSSHNITGVIYMIYGYLFAYVIATLNQNETTFRQSIKTFLTGSIFSAFWAILELVCKVTGIKYPAAVFNTGTASSALGYAQLLGGTSFRLSSVAVEPSIFAQTLIATLALYLPFVFGVPVLFGRALDRWLFGIVFLILCLTTSSTGYLGIFITVLLVLTLFSIKRILKLRHFIALVSPFGAAAAVYATIPVVRDVLDSVLFSKSEGGSALERLMTISNSYEMFLRYPILGIGWASITSHDLIVNILANAGLIGLLSFSVAMYFIFRGLYRGINTRSNSLHIAGLMRMDFALYVALGALLATSALAGFLNTFSFFWFFCGLAIAASGQVGSSTLPVPVAANDRMPTDSHNTSTGVLEGLKVTLDDLSGQ